MAYQITEECIGCTLCAKNCPVKAIQGELKQKHEIDPGLCISCGLCGKLCPKGSILDSQGKPTTKIPKAQWAKPSVNKETCVGCSLCVENCPAFCLEISKPKFHGDIRTVSELVRPQDCIGSGICRRSCPIAAITMLVPEAKEAKAG